MLDFFIIAGKKSVLFYKNFKRNLPFHLKNLETGCPRAIPYYFNHSTFRFYFSRFFRRRLFFKQLRGIFFQTRKNV
jgi:hypothetical protein